MNKKLPLIFVFSLLALILIVSCYFYLSTRKSQIYLPIFHRSPSSELSTLLAEKLLNLESAPIVSSDRIEASISGTIVYFSKDKDLKTQVRALQLVLPRLKMNDRPVKVIDLRFEKVVIRY